MYSSNGMRCEILQITAIRAEKFLTHLANLNDEGFDRFWRTYGTFFPEGAFALSEEVEREYRSAPGLQSGEVPSGGAWLQRTEELSPKEKLELVRREVLRMRDKLREAWVIADPRQKDWRLFLLRIEFNQIAARTVEQMLERPQSGLDSAIGRLSKIPDRAKFCANPMGCQTPYFIAARRSQKYCSEPCAAPAQREHKEQWWKDHKAEISERRSAKRKSTEVKKARRSRK
jgi:hypothetical protein